MVANDKDQEVHPLPPTVEESYLSFPVLSLQWELLVMEPGLSSPRTGNLGHGRRDLILHHSGRKGKDKKRREKEPSMTES